MRKRIECFLTVHDRCIRNIPLFFEYIPRYVSLEHILTICVIVLVRAMQRFIGSLSTKTIHRHRDDIEIISINPNLPIPRSRILLQCHAFESVRAIFQVEDPVLGWQADFNLPPYAVFDLGQDQHPIPVLQLPVVAMGMVAYTLDWHNNWRIEITAPRLRFLYRGEQNPIIFLHLRLIQQIQTSLLAEQVGV